MYIAPTVIFLRRDGRSCRDGRLRPSREQSERFRDQQTQVAHRPARSAVQS